jgi:release factor glutamine methyltransferase
MSDVRLSHFIRGMEKRLANAGIDNPALDARFLVGHALGIDRMEMFAQGERALSNDEIRLIEALVARRARHEPVARILGEREFWGLPFGLNEATLEPRPDSEALIEVTLKHLGKDGRKNVRILDLGTGTACLLLALLHEAPDAMGLGIDVAPRAVQQAQSNAEQLGLSERAVFKVNNWFDNIGEKFDVIICNPPYISSADMPTLMPEVRDFDPHAALDGGKDGLDVYRLLIPQLPGHLKPNGFGVFEIGQGQAAKVKKLFENADFTDIKTHKDLGGIERCVVATQ